MDCLCLYFTIRYKNMIFCEQSVKNTDGYEMVLDMELTPEYILGVIFLVWRGDKDYE